jgi:hypothetical protein
VAKKLAHEYRGPQNHDVENLSSSISFTLIYVVFISVSFHLLSFFFFTVYKFIAQLVALEALELSVVDERAHSLDRSLNYFFFL